MASRRSRGRPRTSAWSATRWEAASAGSGAATACRPTASSRSSWWTPTARSSARPPTRTLTSSGRFAAAAMLMDEAEAGELLAPLRALRPEMDTFATIPATGLQELHMDPPHPVPGKGDHIMLEDLTEAAIEQAVRVAGAESSSPLLSVEFRHLGGALERRKSGHGATGALDARFVSFFVGMTMDEAM